ncbi:MAG: radical SAM protein, partial [Pseudomonadota bacterium]
ISPFVPKPWTPFQWQPFDQVHSLKQKIKIITKGLKKERKITVSYELPKWGYVQTLLSRGDRRAGSILVKAYMHAGDWNRAFRETESHPDFYVYRVRSADEIFPWDFIKHTVEKQQLWKEYQKALLGK